MSWRKQQLQEYYNSNSIIEQDACLIEFVKTHNVKQLCLDGDNDIDYFEDRLPGVTVSALVDHTQTSMLAVLRPNPYVNLEHFLEEITGKVADTQPNYLYIAINKYAVTTEKQWHNLTDCYDTDLLNIINSELLSFGYRELSRHYREDHGQYFNFAHPTTNAYYERVNHKDN